MPDPLTPDVQEAKNINTEQLQKRADWYAEGCDGLEDLEGYKRDGLMEDAATDLQNALDLLDAERSARLAAESDRSRCAQEIHTLRDELDVTGHCLDNAMAHLKTQKERVEAAEQALSRLQWRQIETAPKDGTAIMLCSMAFRKAGETCPLMGMGRWERTNDDAKCEYAWDWAFHLYPVTHWMPLPDPPLTDTDPPKEPHCG